MSQQMRCKPCGYVIEEGKLGDRCPACGVPRKAFEPYKENISARRKFLLGLDLHPIAVHFPQTFLTLIFLILIFNYACSFYSNELITVVEFLSVLIPLTVVAAIISGIIDGKTRFKKYFTKALVLKMIVGAILLLLSIALAVIVLYYGPVENIRLYILILTLLSLICAIFLGTLGKKLMYAILPGK